MTLWAPRACVRRVIAKWLPRPLALGLLVLVSGCWSGGTSKARFAEIVSFDAHQRAEIGQPAPDFLLPDLNGDRVQLSEFAGRIVVLEWFNPECSHIAYAYRQGPLATMAKRWAREDVVWMSINSSVKGAPGSGLEANRNLAAHYGIQHRVLLDERGIVGRAYGAQTTPHYFIVAADGQLAYRGALDNAPEGLLSEKEKSAYVEDALQALLSGARPETPETAPYGCKVKYSEFVR